MNNIQIRTGIIVVFTLIAFIFAACGDDPGGNSDLAGDITITPNMGVTTGTELTAEYDRSKTVSYQWKKDREVISGATSSKYIPPEAGSYTVTVSASGYNLDRHGASLCDCEYKIS